MTEQDIVMRLRIISRIPSWRLWWMASPPSTAQRLVTAVEHLERDILRERTRDKEKEQARQASAR